jgi:hypothetical protein
MIVLMVKKLFALVQDKCVPEGVDCIWMHEIILGGHLYLQVGGNAMFCLFFV